MECVRLRVKDLEFSRHQLTVREGKGEKDRVTRLRRLAKVSLLPDEDQVAGHGAVYPP